MQLLLWPGDLVELEGAGLRSTVEDVVARDAALHDAPVARAAGLAVQPGELADGSYRQLSDLEADMRALGAAPGQGRADPFNTLEGRSVCALGRTAARSPRGAGRAASGASPGQPG